MQYCCVGVGNMQNGGLRVTSRSSVMNSRFTIKSLPYPDECGGYPTSMMIDKPEFEMSFLLSTNTDKRYDRIGDEPRLACSFIQRGTVESSYSTTKENLSQCLYQIDKSKPVIIICHGSFSWRNQMLISNLASKLSTAIDVHTLRFDFTGNGHSFGEWKYNNVEQDYLDILKVVDFVQNGLLCDVFCIIGHSLGSASVLQYAATNAIIEEDNGEKVSCHKYVNLAGRYYSPGEPLRYFSDDDMKQLKEQGYFYLKHPYEDRRVTTSLKSQSNKLRNATIVIVPMDPSTATDEQSD